ncbi:hypothetical protein EST38_g2700 [Candolleomyces aberdarensis]|uniref:Uncharacterized protein n=1 Tax=Candolleomyces aberdarensis TaxID=2316362 RepID=A0A4V1Q4T1_9AGAR|nr:hypothetical protein EST38_g2700 [Candolleomyces aberdarensis]
MKLSAATLTVLATVFASKLAFVSGLPMPFAENDINLSVEMREVDNGIEDVWARDLYAQLLDEIYSRGMDDDDLLLYARSPMHIPIPPHLGMAPKAADLAKNAGARKLTNTLSDEIAKSGSGGQGPKLPITRQDIANAIKKPQPSPPKPAVPNAVALGKQTQQSLTNVAQKINLQKTTAKK